MLASGKHADVTFSVEGQLICAHRNILCARSEYFDTMLCSPFCEGERAHSSRPASEECEGSSPRRKRKVSSTGDEDGGGRACSRTDRTAERPLPVEEATAAAFRAVLHFVYSNEPLLEPHTLIEQMRCGQPTALPRTHALPRPTHCRLPGGRPEPCDCPRTVRCGRLAHRFQIGVLYDACKRETMRRVSAQTACAWLTLSARYGLEDVEEELLQYTVRNWKRICQQHTSTVDVLRDFPEVHFRISLGIGFS
jgi:hypothetical protein